MQVIGLLLNFSCFSILCSCIVSTHFIFIPKLFCSAFFRLIVCCQLYFCHVSIGTVRVYEGLCALWKHGV